MDEEIKSQIKRVGTGVSVVSARLGQGPTTQQKPGDSHIKGHVNMSLKCTVQGAEAVDHW